MEGGPYDTREHQSFPFLSHISIVTSFDWRVNSSAGVSPAGGEAVIFTVVVVVRKKSEEND